MKIFISYSRTDEVLVNLLVYILTKNGFTCLIDRKIQIGRRFDDELQDMIQESDAVLILLTQSSVSSPWVNQEIGFAIAHKKRIFPIAMEKDIKPEGILSTTQSYYLSDWLDIDRFVDILVKALQIEVPAKDELFSDFGFDRVLQGKTARTRFLAHRLREFIKILKCEKNREITILNQSAFSIFAASNDPMYVIAGDHSPEYMKLLLEERAALDELARMPNCSLRLILWPVRAYEKKYLSIRFDTLLKWLEEFKDSANVKYVCAPYPGPNRLIVTDEFCLEGYKLHNNPGYEMSLVKYQREYVNETQRVFESVFEKANMDNEATIHQIRKKYKEIMSH